MISKNQEFQIYNVVQHKVSEKKRFKFLSEIESIILSVK